jgi:uncharacterized protein (TIGR03435 family)
LFPVFRHGGNILMETMSEPDNSLIAEFNARRSEDAFAALVRQHVNLVFATALRQVGDAGAAEEITQNVFVALAQAAGKLGSHPTIAGWLHQTTLNKSREWLRSELRRRKREQAAVNLDLARAEGDSVWSPLVPLLDEALLELREPDRQAVILHYLEGRTFQEVGSALGVGEDAARKRVNRCLDELTDFFRRRGFATPPLASGAPVFALLSHAAPAGLTASATTAGLAAAHSTASTSTLTLIKGALKIMAWTKMKAVVAAGAAVLLATGTTVVIVERVRSPSVDESFWQMKVENLKLAPPVLIIRPTHYYSPSRSGMVSSTDGKTVAQNMNFIGLVREAYSINPSRMALPADFPTNHFDLMLTLPNRQKEALQEEIKRKFGFTARRERRETDVLWLKIEDPGLLAAHVSKLGSKMDFKNGIGLWAWTNYPISYVADFLEMYFIKPVLAQPELADRYNITFQWEDGQNTQQVLRDELAQAGLELVPTNMPIETLVVERAKN